jgi:PAS domain S-box-containing protein
VREDASKVFGVLHPEDVAGVVASIQASARDLTAWSHEYRANLAGGAVHWLFGNSVPEREPDGSILWHGFITDVTERKEVSERALATEQSCRDQFTRNSAVMILVNPRDGRIVDANPAALRFYGYSQAEMLTKVISEINVLDAAELRRAMASVSPETGSRFHFQHRLADGSVRHVSVSSSRIHRGKEELLHSIIFDITERVQAETSLRDTQQQLAWAMDQAHLAYWEFRLQGYVFTFNDQFYSLYGTSVEIEGGYSMRLDDYMQAFLLPDEQPLLSDQVRQAVLSGQPESKIEHRMRRRDGEIRHMVVRFDAIRDEQGRPHRIRGIAQDITDRRRAEEALRRSEASFRSVVAAMAEGLVVQRADGAIIDCNQQAEKILGLTRDQLLGKSSLDEDWRLVREDGRKIDGSEHPAMVTLRSGQRCTNVAMGLCQPGDTLRWINVNTEPLLRTGESQPYAVVVTFADISEKIHDRRKLQELLAQTERDARLKAALLREVNHRVTNNLTSVLGLFAFEEESTARDDFPAVAAVLRRLSERLRSLLEVHRMIAQAGWVPVQVDRLATRVIHAALAAAAGSQPPVVDIAPSPLLVSPRQASSLALLLSELTTNTVKYASQPDHPVVIRFSTEQPQDDAVILRYRDNGPGYPPDVLAQQRSNIGLKLIREIVATTLRGTVAFTNDHGAVTAIRMRAEDETRT